MNKLISLHFLISIAMILILSSYSYAQKNADDVYNLAKFAFENGNCVSTRAYINEYLSLEKPSEERRKDIDAILNVCSNGQTNADDVYKLAKSAYENGNCVSTIAYINEYLSLEKPSKERRKDIEAILDFCSNRQKHADEVYKRAKFAYESGDCISTNIYLNEYLYLEQPSEEKSKAITAILNWCSEQERKRASTDRNIMGGSK